MPTYTELLEETCRDPREGQSGQVEVPGQVSQTSVYAGFAEVELDQQARSTSRSSTSPLPTGGQPTNGGDQWSRFIRTTRNNGDGAPADEAREGGLG